MNVIDPQFLEKVVPKVTEDMNEKLIAPFTAEDVKKKRFLPLVTLRSPVQMVFMLYLQKILALGG